MAEINQSQSFQITQALIVIRPISRLLKLTMITSRQFFIGVMILISVSMAANASGMKERKPAAEAPQANIVIQTEWVATIRQGLIKKLCAPDSIAIKCFRKMTVNECADQLRSDVQICATYSKLPPQIDRRKMSTKVAFNLGDCAGARFSKFNNARLIEDPECRSEGKVK